MSSAAPMGANTCMGCFQVAACSWSDRSAGPRRRTEEEALHRRIEDAHTHSHGHAGPASAVHLWIYVHRRDPTSVVHPLHMFPP